MKVIPEICTNLDLLFYNTCIYCNFSEKIFNTYVLQYTIERLYSLYKFEEEKDYYKK